MKPRIHLLYEHGPDGLPFGASYLRLLRPLSHPRAAEAFYVTPMPVLLAEQGEVEMVIVDRLWRPDATLPQFEDLVTRIRRMDAKLIYALDDDLLSLPPERSQGLPVDFRASVSFLLEEADAVLVTTDILAQRVKAHTQQVWTVPNALDERLIGSPPLRSLEPNPWITLGYMGTLTHDDDLTLLLEALPLAIEASDVPLMLEMVGGAAREAVRRRFDDLPLPVRWIEPPDVLYPGFLSWFTGHLSWQIGLAPLLETRFNQAKSDIKFLDYAALGATGIYSQHPAYTHSAGQGERGILVEASPRAWGQAIADLAADANHRRTLADNARRYLFSQRILGQTSAELAATLEQIWHG